jgi:uncharacterized protein (TIGR02265 family)
MAGTAQGSVFEGLFKYGVKVTPEMKVALVEAGYNPDKPQPTYPSAVWARCMEIAARMAYPALPLEEAYYQVGRTLTLGFLNTLAGKMVKVLVPLISVSTMFRRYPRWMSMGRDDMRMVCEEVGPCHVVLHVVDAAGLSGQSYVGMFDVSLELMGAKGTLEIKRKSPTEFDIDVKWA